MKKWYREIKAVGIRDWLWFVVYLKRDECSNKLCILKYYKKYGKDYVIDLICDRNRAHNIDNILSDLDKGED